MWSEIGQVEPGTALLTRDGDRAVLERATWRDGEFEVFNFTVDNRHNYFVAGSERVPGALVHNCGPKLGTTVDVDAPGMSVRDFGLDTSGAPSGNYDIEFSSGYTYHGKGLPDRAEESAMRVASEHGDTIVSVTNTAQPNSRAAFKAEARNIEASGGVGGDNYNKINSPGKKMIEEDGY